MIGSDDVSELSPIVTQDDDAFASIAAALDRDLRRFARRLLRAPTMHDDAVSDAVQDTLIALHRRLPHIQPPSQIRPYAFGIIRRRCMEELRRRMRRREVAYVEEPDEDGPVIGYVPDPGAGPEDAVHLLLLDIAVHEAIDRLPEVQRQTLLLFAQANLSYEEIASVMEVSVGTVKSRLFYAKRTLTALIAPDVREAIAGVIG